MKLVRYGDAGAERPGLLDGETLRDLGAVTGDIDAEWLSAGLSSLAGRDWSSLAAVPSPRRFGPVVSHTPKLIGVGLNYADHARESGAEIPSEPTLFMKATSAICGCNDAVRLPPGSQTLDWEVELGVVIGAPCREISEDDAPEHIAGYCIVNDVSERTFQHKRGGQWVKGKSADTFAPVGPYLVTKDEVPDPQQLDIWLEVNGELQQHSNTAEMLFGPFHLVAYISQFMTLQPGDIVSTGTPSGVGGGKKPPRFLQAGDVMRLSVSGLGEQEQRVVQADG